MGEERREEEAQKLSHTLIHANFVVVGQTVGSISSKTLAYTTVCAHLNCAQHWWLLPFIRTLGKFSAQCLSKLYLKELIVLLLTTSFGRAFQVVVILIGEKCRVAAWCCAMFYNKFCSLVNCSVIIIFIEEPSCTGSSIFTQLNTSISFPRSLLCTRLKGWWDQGPGFAGGSCDFWFQKSTLLHFAVSFLFYKCLLLNVAGTRIALHVPDVANYMDL